MRIAYTNLVDTATAPTALTTDLLYPVANLQNQRLSKRWRSTAATAQTVIVDLSAATAINTLGIVGHTFTSAATITVDGNATDSWGSPTFTTSLTYNAGVILNYLASAQTFRYWRFTIDDASAASGYVEAGRLWLGTYLTIDPSSTLGFTVTKARSDTVVYGRDRQKYATEGVGWRRFSLSFPRTGGTALTAIQTMYDAVGNHGSVIFCNFDSDRSYQLVDPCYCSIVGEIGFQHTRSMKFGWSLELEEDR